MISMAQDTLLGFPAHTLPFQRGKFTTLLTVSLASSISCWPLFSVPGMGSISARCTGRGLICGAGEGFVFGCVYPEEDDRAAWAILLRKNRFSPGFVKFLPKFKKVLASYTGVRCTILSRKKRGEMACWPEPLR